MELKLVDNWSAVNAVVLLIVPYGIETWWRMVSAGGGWSFNRTLWN